MKYSMFKIHTWMSKLNWDVDDMFYFVYLDA